MEFSFLLNSCLDIFEIRQKQTSVDQELGLLHAFDERLAAYGWLTTTGVKLLVIVDFLGEPLHTSDEESRLPTGSSIKESDLKPVFRALQAAYIQLLQNPFYSPDDHTPAAQARASAASSMRVTDQKFISEVKRIGEAWNPGVSSL
ncbi:Sedlin [Aspergillus floccosus]